MDRRALLAADYPSAGFVDAFYHVVWARRGALSIPPERRFAPFRDAARSILTRSLLPDTCRAITPDQLGLRPLPLCPECSDASAWLFDASEPCARMCPPRAMTLIRHLFFSPGQWEGELPPCAVRCHLIVTSKDPWEKAEAIIMHPPRAFPHYPHASHAVNCVELVLDRETTRFARLGYTENMTAITAALVILCKAVAPAESARQMYIDLREALRTGTVRTPEIESLRALVLKTLFGTDATDYEVGGDLRKFMADMRDFLDRHAALSISAHDLPSLSELRPRRSSKLVCKLTRDHERVEHVSQFGSYVELFWPDAQMSALECRLSIRLWTKILGFVDPMHVLIKTLPCGKNAVVLRRADYVRLLQYAPSRLHCARVISLSMPVYKMLCQNYVEANMTHDAAGAVAFAKDLMSLLTVSVPETITDAAHANLGMLHPLLNLYGDSLHLHLQKPLLEPNCMRITANETSLRPEDVFGATLPESARITPFHNAADNATMVDGFLCDSENMYGCLVGFLCIKEPHVIRAESVRVLFEIMTRNVRDQPTFRVAMSVVAELWSRFSRPNVTINGKNYIDIPLEMPGNSVHGVPPVTYIYGFLLSKFIDVRQAGQLLTTIRLCPEKTPFLSRPTPLRLAETRDEGIPGLRSLAREYSSTPPSGPFAQLYSLPAVAELGCLHYALFYMEMLTYVQCKALHTDNIDRLIKDYARCGNRPRPPLRPTTYRGSVAPAHVVRYARRDFAHDPARTRHAYELEPGVFQHEVVPTVRFCESVRNEDFSRMGMDTPFVGGDPLLVEAVFMIPIDRIVIESREAKAKRKLDEQLTDTLARDPDIIKRMRRGLGPPSPRAWADEVRIVDMALSSR